jgi:phosphohistidine phosphatase
LPSGHDPGNLNIMKTLFLGRHAKSSWDDSGLSDFERPLNDRGERDAPEMGRRLAEKHRTADVILCSAAVRARTTAAILAKEWGYEGDLLLEPKLYEASSSQMLDFIQEMEDEAMSALVVAHNPTITWLANLLGNLSIDNVPTCGIVALKIPCSNWSEVEVGRAELIEFDFPKKGEA